MADHSVSPRWVMLFSEVLPTKKDAATLDLTCKIFTHLKNVAFFTKGKNLKEKHGGSSRAAKLHGVS